jgi:N-sulfoglucosamine sulfohydrolase
MLAAIGRRAFSFIVLLGVAAAGCSSFEGADTVATVSRPNIVFMVVEDLSPRIGAFGDKVALTPNLDRLASEGVRYTSVFAASGVCAPSRAALITGMHQNSIGAQGMRTSSFVWRGSSRKGYEAPPPPHVKAFPELMRAAGYYTINNAKTDYQFGNPFTVWDENGAQAHWQDRPQGAPFFAMYSFNLTHESALFLAGSINAAGASSEPNAIQAAAGRKLLAKPTRPEDVEVPPYYPDTPAVRDEIVRHYDNVQLMDAWVGERMKELEQAGLLTNTIVIWTTDHGDGLPRGKRSLYDSGLKAPMLIRFPDRRGAGSVDDRLISFVDLAPTLLFMAGIDAPSYQQGRNILDRKLPDQAYVFAARDRFDEAYIDRSRAVRSKTFKYIRNFMPDAPFYGDIPYRDNLATMREMQRLRAEGKLSPLQAGYFTTPRPVEELYNLVADPDEVDNLASDPRYGDEKLKLRNALEQWQADVPDLGAIPEREMVERMMWPGGVQPVTAAPFIWSYLSASGKRMAALQSTTGGASIGYRINADMAALSAAPWSLYVGPIEIGPGDHVEAKAIRYGYVESEISRMVVSR